MIAINAQLAVARAGEEGQAFEVISGQLERFSRETPEMIQQIHREAVAMIRLLAKVHRTERAHAGFETARAKVAGDDDGGPDYLAEALALDRERLAEARQQARENLQRFCKLLDEVESKLAAASHLALNARVEAAKISEFREQFASVAQEVAQTVESTREVIQAVHGEMAALRGRDGLAEGQS